MTVDKIKFKVYNINEKEATDDGRSLMTS